MTQEEAVSLLRRYRRTAYPYNSKHLLFPRRDIVFQTCVYGGCLIDELIRKIRCSQSDPIRIVSEFYSKLDDVLCESDDDHFITHAFAGILENETGHILRYLRRIEKEKKEDAKNQLEEPC